MRINSFLIICFSLLMASCQNNTKYHSYRSTSTNGWHKGDTLIYQLPATLEKGIYAIEIGVRHNSNYKYRNLWVEITENLSSSKGVKRDSIQLILADKSGKWIGTGISGLYQNDSIINKTFKVEYSYKPNIYVRHIMRDSNLKGISDVGIKLMKVSN